MKKKYLSYIGKLSKRDFMDILKEVKEFKNLNNWKIKKLNVGETIHTYILEKGKKRYFTKEVKPHEAQVNYFLSILKLKSLPYSIYPELLSKGILVMPFIKGRMLREKKISDSLLRDFVTFQNKMDDKSFSERYNITKLRNFSQKDGGFFRKEFLLPAF